MVGEALESIDLARHTRPDEDGQADVPQDSLQDALRFLPDSALPGNEILQRVADILDREQVEEEDDEISSPEEAEIDLALAASRSSPAISLRAR